LQGCWSRSHRLSS